MYHRVEEAWSARGAGGSTIRRTCEHALEGSSLAAGIEASIRKPRGTRQRIIDREFVPEMP